MPILRFRDFTPDAADFESPGAILVKNAVPASNSYQPISQLVPSTNALDAYPRGAIEGTDKNENVYQYAGDAAKLYSLAGGVWSDVSNGGGYSSGASERWEFVRWREKIIATNFSNNPQAITFGGANFADLTTALRFRHVAVVREFIVAGYTFDGTDGIVRDRVWWSAQADETDWTPSAVTLSDRRDLGVGGGVQAIVGGEHGLIVMEKSTFRMTFAGAPLIFQIDEILPGVGSVAPGAVVRLGDLVMFPSEHGFFMVRGGAQSVPIGEGRVDKFFINDLDADYLHRVSSVSDPKTGNVFWLYPGAGNAGGTPNKMLIFNPALNRWGYAEIQAELVWRSGGTAQTLESLDDLNLGSDLVLTGDFASDTNWTKGTGWAIAAGVATHTPGTASELSQSIAVTTDVYYRLQFDVSGRTAGSVTPNIGGTNGTAIVADATGIKESIRCGSSDTDIAFACSSDFDGSIDNVSVQLISDLDTMPLATLDSAEFKGVSPLLAAFNPSFENGNFSGPPYSATFETQEVEIHEGRRTRIDAFLPVVDGGSSTARIGTRNRQIDNVVYSPSLTQSATGRFTHRSNARYHRFELTVSDDWEDAIGVQVTDARRAEGRG